MFDRIAHRYDLLNRLLSLGQDIVWRQRVAQYLPEKSPLHLLDMATGTADQLLMMYGKTDRITSAVGMDMSEQMLAVGRNKIRERHLEHIMTLQTGDATQIPAPDQTFDVVTISFGIRNVSDVDQALREMYRVLKPAGRALILEFSLPQNRFLRGVYLFYFRYVLPVIGGMISGDRYAYNYLNKTVETFPYGEAFCQRMRSAGFIAVQANPLTFGIATIYQGDKAS